MAKKENNKKVEEKNQEVKSTKKVEKVEKAKKVEKTKKADKNKKSFYKDFKAELKKVVWPTKKQLINNTTAVITIVLITAAIVFVLDFTFENVNKVITNQVKNLQTTIHKDDAKPEENKEENNNAEDNKEENNNAEENKVEENKTENK